MSSSNHARTSSYSARRSAATAENTTARSRPTSGAPSNNKEKTTNMKNNLSPQSPFGSSQPRRSLSNSQKSNGESIEQRERRSERVNVTTREYVTLRTRSPVREPTQSETRTREWDKSKQTSRGAVSGGTGFKLENEPAESPSHQKSYKCTR